MAQAKRKPAQKKAQSNHRPMHGLGMLITGMAIGSMATILWQGMRSDDEGVGSGIRQMIEQSRQLVAALEKAGKPHHYIEQPYGDHFLSNQEHRIEFFSAMDEFLEQHIGRGPMSSSTGTQSVALSP